MDLKVLKKSSDGELTLDGKIVEGQKVGEIEIEEPIENILSSRGAYNPLRFRERRIPLSTEAFYVEEIKCVVEDPLQAGITDYKAFRVEFYRDIKESYPNPFVKSEILFRFFKNQPKIY